MTSTRTLIAIALAALTSAAMASDAISPEYVKNLSYRGGYVNFRLVGDDGTNYCSACPADPGGMSTQQCWIAETQKVEVGILLLASSQRKKVSGRVSALASDCGLYQFSMQD